MIPTKRNWSKYCKICRQSMRGYVNRSSCEACEEICKRIEDAHAGEGPEHHTPDRIAAVQATTERIQAVLFGAKRVAA